LDCETNAGYTPLHVASHFGSASMVRYLLEQSSGGRGDDGHVRVDVQNELGYTPLHQAAQQGHSQIVTILLENNASPNTVSNVGAFGISLRSYSVICNSVSLLQNGQTALSIAQRLGYISVVETLKVVTETEVTTTTTTTVEEKYKVMAPESMQETFLSDSEDEGGKLHNSDAFAEFLDQIFTLPKP
jgi:ankyrin